MPGSILILIGKSGEQQSEQGYIVALQGCSRSPERPVGQRRLYVERHCELVYQDRLTGDDGYYKS